MQPQRKAPVPPGFRGSVPRGLAIVVVAIMRKLEPVTLGELLLEEFLKPMASNQYRLAEEVGVPAQRIGGIVAGKRGISAEIREILRTSGVECVRPPLAART